MNNQIKLLSKLVKSPARTHKALLNCVKKNVVLEKIKIHLMKEDIKNFLEWMRTDERYNQNTLMEFSRRVKSIHIPYVSSDLYGDALEHLFETYIPGNMYYRVKFNLNKIVSIFEKTYDTTFPRKKLGSLYTELKNMDDIDQIYERINHFFENTIGKSYDTFEKIYESHERKRQQILFQNWNLPKFYFIEKTSIQPIQKMQRSQYLGGGEIEDEDLANIARMTGKNVPKTLTIDYENIYNLTLNLLDENAIRQLQNLWRNTVFEYYSRKKKKLSTRTRKALYVLFTYVVEEIPLDVLIEHATETMDIDSLQLRPEGKATSQLNAIMQAGYLTKYYPNLLNYITPSRSSQLHHLKTLLAQKGISAEKIDHIERQVRKSLQKNTREPYATIVKRVIDRSNLSFNIPLKELKHYL